MPSQYKITEPHPSLPQSHYALVGRGGAGNFTHVDPKSTTAGPDATGPASRTKLTAPPSTAYFVGGRGGAGNLHQQRERAIFSFDEELERQRKMLDNQAPFYHVGRGGAGNFASEYDGAKKTGSASSGVSDGSSAHARLDSAWERLSRRIH